MRRCPSGITEGGVALHFLDHLLIFLGCLDAGHAQGDDLDAPQVTPLGGEDIVEGVRQIQGVGGDGRVADAHVRDTGKRRLEGGEQLGLELTIDLASGVFLLHVAAQVGVEQDGVGDTIAVFAEAADGNIHVQSGVLIHHTEGHGRGGTVLVAHQLLGIEIVDALILGRLAAEGEALADILEYRADVLAQAAGEQGGLGREVIGILARFGAHVYHLPLLYDHHALAIGHGDDRAVGDDIVAAVLVGGAAGDSLLSLYRQHLCRNRIAIEKFLPLICHDAACCAHCCFHQSHSVILLSDV